VLSVTAFEQVPGSCLEALGAEQFEAEDVGQPVDVLNAAQTASASSTGADSRSASTAATFGPSWYACHAVALCAPMQNADSFT
jgi:hypothetical protein